MNESTPRSASSPSERRWEGRVLILDSDRQIRALVAEWLEMAGYVFEEAHPTSVVPEAAARCGIVLVDVRSPPRAARQTLVGIQALAPHAAIIAMSADGLASGSSALEAVERELGVIAVLVKPFGRNDLMQALERAQCHLRKRGA